VWLRRHEVRESKGGKRRSPAAEARRRGSAEGPAGRGEGPAPATVGALGTQAGGL